MYGVQQVDVVPMDQVLCENAMARANVWAGVGSLKSL